MTGYARVAEQSPLGRLQLEIRSVNHRYLDVSLRTPEELRAFEPLIRTVIGEHVNRGKLDVGLRLQPAPDTEAGLALDDALLDAVAKALGQIEGRLGGVASPDPVAVLRWPGILREPEFDVEAMTASMTALVDNAVAEFNTARNAEGARLGVLIAERLDTIAAVCAAVTERLPAQREAWEQKFSQRLEELSELEPERRDQAVVQFLQKMDVDEELTRLQSHCTEVRDCLEKKGPIGRKLDFFMQELNREANTLGSKSMDAEITKLVVELKVTIEQMREQVQNIE